MAKRPKYSAKLDSAHMSLHVKTRKGASLLAYHFTVEGQRLIEILNAPWPCLRLGRIDAGAVLEVYLPKGGPRRAILYSIEWRDEQGGHQCARVNVDLTWELAHRLHAIYAQLTKDGHGAILPTDDDSMPAIWQAAECLFFVNSPQRYA